MINELATSVPAEVTSSLSLDTVVTLAIISAICSAVALILNTIIPLITQCLNNKHALKMAKIEQWDKIKFDAYQQFVAGAEILASFDNHPSSTISNACIGIAKILPYLDGNDLKKASDLLSDLHILENDSVHFMTVRIEYVKLLNTMAKKFEEPSVSHKLSRIRRLLQKTKEIFSSSQRKQKKQSKDQ